MSGRFMTEVPGSTEAVLSDVGTERERQFAKWGPQHYADGTGPTRTMVIPALIGDTYARLRDRARESCDAFAADNDVTWLDILFEEVFEAAAEEDIAMLRKELVQVGAVAAAWIEDIDSRATAEGHDLGGEA